MRGQGAFAFAVGALVGSIAVSAHAQSALKGGNPSIGLPQTTVIPTRPGDTSSDSAGLPLDLGMLPMRLSMTTFLWPQGKLVLGCDENTEYSANTSGYFPLQRAAAMHLVPRLTLVGFSTTRCPVDTTAGAGLMYTAPIRKDVWLVASAQIPILPTTTFVQKPTVPIEPRVDVVLKSSQDKTFSVGVGRRGLLFGGAF